MARRGELTHLGLSPPMSIGGSWPLFISWALVVICGWSSLFVGSCLCFLDGCGGGVVVGGCGQSGRVVVEMSVVGSGDKHGWWWWEEESGCV